MSQVNAIVINITLDGQNYPEWSFCVETALRAYGLLFQLSDDPLSLRKMVVMQQLSKNGILMMAKSWLPWSIVLRATPMYNSIRGAKD